MKKIDLPQKPRRSRIDAQADRIDILSELEQAMKVTGIPGFTNQVRDGTRGVDEGSGLSAIISANPAEFSSLI
ncbi:hypothetical protein HY990_07165 [Candidatus Micrarchaeota archaeon]|nr:hypothetical protein [Candidatus Micrarchaeota archaeon]